MKIKIFVILLCLLKTLKPEFNQHQKFDKVPIITYADLAL